MEFVSPYLVSIPIKKGEILQLGMPPNIIDILLKIAGIQFNTAWKRRVKSRYGKIKGNWIDIDSLIRAKKRINHPRHQEDVRILIQIKQQMKKKSD